MLEVPRLDARGALAASLARRRARSAFATLAQHGPREGNGRGPLAHARRALEQVGIRVAAAGRDAGQERNRVGLADDFGEQQGGHVRKRYLSQRSGFKD